MINSIFILDKSKTVVDVLSNNGDSPQSPFFDDKYVQDLATGAETFEFTTVSNERTSKYTVAGNYVAFKFKNKIKMFQIMETKEEHQEALYKSCYCEIAGLELINNVIREREIPSANVRQFFEIALADTDWKLGIVDAALVLSSNIKIERATNVYSLIQEHLNTFDMEIEYRFEMTGNRVSGMYIDVYKNRGRETGFRFEYGQNVSGVSKQVDMSELCTAMIGIGKDNIDFKSVEWGADMPALKPLNQDFIVDVEAHKLWNNNGSYLMGTYTSQTESPHELLTLTWNELQRRKQPKMTYDIQVEMLQGYDDEISIGDTVKVIDNDYIPALHLTARIGRLELSFTDYRQNKCILTNFKEVKSGILSLDTVQAIIDGKFPIGSEQIQDGAITEGKIDTQYLHTIKTDVLIAAKVEAEELIADKANIKDLEATNAIIENLKAKDAEIENAVIENLKVTTAEIDKLKAKDATIENLVADKANISDLNATSATINELQAGKADITELNAVKANINVLKADIAEIDTLLAGNITADNIQSGSITANEIASGTITAVSGVIADGAIGNAQISSLDAAKINAGTIDTSKVTVAGPNSNLKMSGNRLQVFTGIGSKQVERVSLGDVKGDGSQYGLLVRGADGKTIIMDENGVTNAGITDGSITNDKINPDANIDGAKLNINSVITRINKDGSESIQGTKIDIEGTSLSTKLSNITTTQTAQGNKISEHSSKIAANESAINLKVDSQTYQSDKEGIETQLNKNTADIALNKEQIALKVEQSDINKAKLELEGKIDTKVNAAKAEIKVTTDKISQNVSNLTTTVGSKADGSTVSTLSNKVGSLETSINGISGKVSSLETTTTSINSTATNALNKASSASTAASTAQNTADSKAKVFTSTPTTPYKVGDIWTAGPSGDLMKCKIARASGSYVASDWEKASKYTDDTKANAVDGKVNTLQGEVNTVKSNVASLDVNLQGITQRVSSTESTVTTHTTQLGTVDSRINTAKNQAIVDARKAQDTRSTNENPQWYFTNYPRQTITEFKYANVIGIGTSAVYGTLETKVPWNDASGGYPVQTFRSNSTATYERKGTSTTAWGAWKQIEDISGSQAKANQALTDAKAFTTTEVSKTNSKVASIETNLNGITSRVSSVETTATTITDLAKAMAGGKILYTDPMFKKGNNGISVYNNSNNGTVVVNRIGKIAGCPTSSTHCLEVKTTGAASPAHGGFYFGTGTRANQILITRIIAKIPTGRNITFASNAYGSGGQQKWLTPVAGTGKWEEYLCQVKCGESGSFSSTNFFYLSGGVTPTTSNPLVWHVAYATVIDITDSDESVNDLSTRMSSAEQKIKPDAIVSTVTSSQTYKDNLTGKVSTNQIISSINQTAESIKIQASKLDLNGYATFSALSGSGTTVINGANITTGYINGSRIKGGVISATEEINFAGGARIFGNTGAYDAGLTISAQSYNFGGATDFIFDGKPVITGTSKNGYYGLSYNRNDSNWIRTTVNGLIPYQSGGASSLGTSSWPFNNIYGKNIYENGISLSSKYAASSHSHSNYLSTSGGTISGSTLQISGNSTWYANYLSTLSGNIFRGNYVGMIMENNTNGRVHFVSYQGYPAYVYGYSFYNKSRSLNPVETYNIQDNQDPFDILNEICVVENDGVKTIITNSVKPYSVQEEKSDMEIAYALTEVNEEGEIITTTNTSGMISLLTDAIKKLKEENNALKENIDMIKKKLDL